MSIIKNGKNIIGVYKGDIPILKIFKHNNLVYQLSSTGGTETQYDITSTFNVTSTTSPTQLCHSSAISYFTEMYVDGVQIDVASGYTFNTTGEHTVQYMLADKTKIGDNAFRDCQRLSSIVIPDTVTSVGTYSFFGCSSLNSIDFGKGIKTIGNAVFYYCSSLTSIVIPSSVETIGLNAFNTCIFYKDNFINNSSATGYPWSAVIYDTIQDDGLYINGTTVVKCKENAINVTIPESITDIGDGAFIDCSSLTEITCLPTTAPTLNVNVFMGLPESGTLTYPCGSDYSTWLEQLRWKDTCNQGGQEKWVTLTQDTSRSIKMQTFRIDTSTTPEMPSGYYFITFSTEPDYPGENEDITRFSICINEDRIFDDGSLKTITSQKHIEGNVYEYTFSVPVYFAGGERNAPLSQVQYKTTSGDTPVQERWVTLTQNTDRSIQMQTFRIDTTYPEFEDGNRFITFSETPDYPSENADLTNFSICINEDTIYDNHSRKYIRDQKHIEGNVYEYTFSVPVYFAGGERNAPLSQVQYKTTSEDTPDIPVEEVSPYDITAKFDVNSISQQTALCYKDYTSAFTEMYVDNMQISPTSAYTFSSTGEHTVGYMLKDKTTLAGNMINGHFKGCSRMTEIKFKDELTSISGPSFSGCTSLQKVTFGSGLTSVGSSGGFAFSIFTGCTSLREITCLAPTAPTLLTKSIQGVENNNGVLYVPNGSDYRSWTSILSSWTIQYIT